MPRRHGRPSITPVFAIVLVCWFLFAARLSFSAGGRRTPQRVRRNRSVIGIILVACGFGSSGVQK